MFGCGRKAPQRHDKCGGKSEIRNKSKIPIGKCSERPAGWVGIFEFAIAVLFRISDFEFRIWAAASPLRLSRLCGGFRRNSPRFLLFLSCGTRSSFTAE